MKRENRILKHREFDEIIRSTPAIKSKNYVIHYRKNEENKARIGISVSKKNGNAVTRNRIKRQIRAMIGEIYPLTASYDIIIIVRVAYDVGEFHLEKEELASLLGKIGE